MSESDTRTWGFIPTHKAREVIPILIFIGGTGVLGVKAFASRHCEL